MFHARIFSRSANTLYTIVKFSVPQYVTICQQPSLSVTEHLQTDTESWNASVGASTNFIRCRCGISAILAPVLTYLLIMRLWWAQVGYFWVTLTAMVALYSGIYRVALDLHRRSEEKRRKQETSLATMAHQTVSHLGTAVIGMTRSAQLDAQIMQQQVRVDCLEEASTHNSAKTHAGNVFVTRDLDLLTQN